MKGDLDKFERNSMTDSASSPSYDGTTRFLHWAMALLLIWQLGGVLAEATLGETPLIKSWGSTHSSVGALILLFTLIRLIWAVLESGNRPARQTGFATAAARFGHGLLYAAMVIIPSLALVRSVGSGRGLTLFGVEILEPTGQKIPELMAPANALHGLFGWILLVLIIGHISMALYHHFILKDGTLGKMLPRFVKRDAANQR